MNFSCLLGAEGALGGQLHKNVDILAEKLKT
jgi:hypothetical protein